MTDRTELVLFCAAILIMLILFLFTLYLTLFKFIPAIKSIGLKKSLYKYKFSAAWSLINLFVLLAIYIQYKINEFDDAASHIPAKLLISTVVSSGSEGFIGGCTIEVSKLTDKTIRDIKTQGINYFDRALTSRYEDKTHQGSTYMKWNETPIPFNGWSDSEGSLWFMCDQIDDNLERKIEASAAKSGGYFTTGTYSKLVELPDLGLIIYTFYK